MTSGLPDPLVPAEVDLRGYEFMPYYGDRLRESDLNSRATDAEYRAAHNLWWSSWKQVPAASLPDDDAILARLADLGRDVKTWAKVRDVALRGFVKCTDGRLYHRVLSAVAIEAWEGRKAMRDRTEKARQARLLQRLSQTTDDTKYASVTDSIERETERGTEIETETETGKPESRARASRLPDDWNLPDAWLFWTRTEKPHWPLPYIRDVKDRFKDYWIAKPGRDGVKLNWEATWRNWVRRENDPRGVGGNGASKQAQLEARNAEVGNRWLEKHAPQDAKEIKGEG